MSEAHLTATEMRFRDALTDWLLLIAGPAAKLSGVQLKLDLDTTAFGGDLDIAAAYIEREIERYVRGEATAPSPKGIN